MKLGIFAKTFSGRDLDEILNQVVESGFETVQFNMVCAGLHSLPDEYPDAAMQLIRNSMSKHHLTVTALSGTFNMVHPLVEAREVGLRQLNLMMENVKQINTNIITICTGSKDPGNMWRFHPGNNSKQAWGELCIVLERALTTAEQEDIILAFEPELNNVVNSAEKGLQLLKEMNSDHLKVVFDPANLFEKCSSGEAQRIIEGALDLLFESTIIIHAKDRLADGTFVPAGKGLMPYSFLLKFLTKNQYPGNIIVHEVKAEDAKSCAQFIKTLL